MKKKLLCVLHRSPPAHGAAKVGDFIGNSEKLQEEYDCRFITIKSSDTIGDIGKVSLKKIYLLLELYFKVLWMLLVFRPQKLYFTASVRGVALYRDILISTLWKTYSFFISLDVYYHYHTKGINKFVILSPRNLKLTNFFVKDVNLILLSPLLENDFKHVNGYKNILFLPNGVENSYTEEEFDYYISNKNFGSLNILYLSNMIKSKGYFEVLKLAKNLKEKKNHFHFAGGWQNESDKKEFFIYIQEHNLENIVTFHGFVNGEQKKNLFEKAHVLVFPTRYDLESFGLVITEAFSYGLPVLSTDEGSIPYIIDEKSGRIVKDINNLTESFNEIREKLVNRETAMYCRQRYLDNFSLEQFEESLVEIFR